MCVGRVFLFARKYLFDGGTAKFRTAVFVKDALVVHGARPSAPPFVAHADIAELPDIHALAKGISLAHSLRIPQIYTEGWL